ncbi:hypothetical protein FOA52_000336 [Chlamydomonas sp. UWO 241]|nr:hypothetical protein FOA52_000336 [Chlamydomonas sp. UWO 241]
MSPPPVDNMLPSDTSESAATRPQPSKRAVGGYESAAPVDHRVDIYEKDKLAQYAPPPPRPSCVRGNPGPVGLLAFGMTTLMLMFIETGWTATSDGPFKPTVIAYAMFYGGLAQFIAGILELIKGSTFAGTAFMSYGAFWMGWFMLEYFLTIDPILSNSLTGKTLWLALWGVLTSGFFVVTLRKNFGLMYVFSSLAITFFMLAGGVYSYNTTKAAGYVGFSCGSAAIYTALAMLYQDELGIVLPFISPVNFI